MAFIALHTAFASPSALKMPVHCRAPQRLGRFAPVRCSTRQVAEADEPRAQLGRRGVLSAFVVSLGVAMEGPAALARPANETGDGALVRAYLPEAEPGFFEYAVKLDRTPALRALNLEPYRFILPGDFKVVGMFSENCPVRGDWPHVAILHSVWVWVCVWGWVGG
jgi:hypothetical protein